MLPTVVHAAVAGPNQMTVRPHFDEHTECTPCMKSLNMCLLPFSLGVLEHAVDATESLDHR